MIFQDFFLKDAADAEIVAANGVHRFFVVGSPGTNLAGSLPHELVINLGKVESNMAGIL